MILESDICDLFSPTTYLTLGRRKCPRLTRVSYPPKKTTETLTKTDRIRPFDLMVSEKKYSRKKFFSVIFDNFLITETSPSKFAMDRDVVDRLLWLNRVRFDSGSSKRNLVARRSPLTLGEFISSLYVFFIRKIPVQSAGESSILLVVLAVVLYFSEMKIQNCVSIISKMKCIHFIDFC